MADDEKGAMTTDDGKRATTAEPMLVVRQFQIRQKREKERKEKRRGMEMENVLVLKITNSWHQIFIENPLKFKKNK